MSSAFILFTIVNILFFHKSKENSRLIFSRSLFHFEINEDVFYVFSNFFKVTFTEDSGSDVKFKQFINAVQASAVTQPRAQLQLSPGWQQKIIFQNHTLQEKIVERFVRIVRDVVCWYTLLSQKFLICLKDSTRHVFLQAKIICLTFSIYVDSC